MIRALKRKRNQFRKRLNKNIRNWSRQHGHVADYDRYNITDCTIYECGTKNRVTTDTV